MTLIIQKPAGAKLNLRKTWQPMDADAAAYITAVETADAQALENGVKVAIDNFVLGCKADGIWNAIKASCILAGARTLAGSLVPLVGTAPTNVGPFVSGDYNRKTGLGDATNTTKYLNSNRNNNADPQNSKHVSVYASTLPTSTVSQVPRLISSGDSTGADTIIHRLNNNGDLIFNVNSSSFDQLSADLGFLACSRSLSASYSARRNNATTSFSRTSATPRNANIGIFASVDGQQIANARLAFYSIGESLDLALLDARVTDLINAFAAAIP
jgi:hypothetical protein